MKRYNIINMYIQGSNVSPQVSHGLNNLWKSLDQMSLDAKSLFLHWAHSSEVEINLQGGSHKDLEALYASLKDIQDIPSAKFNESQDALCGACTVVTFVASERIVAINNYIRYNRVKKKDFYKLRSLTFRELEIPVMDDEMDKSAEISDSEINVATYISRLPTAR